MRRARAPQACRAARGLLLVLGFGIVSVRAALATPLENVIPGLFGGTLNTTVNVTLGGSSTQTPLFVQRFRNLSAELAAARSQVPIPSSSGAFSFAWDSDLDTFVRSEQSLGPLFGERAQTLGRGRFTAGLSYQRINFDSLEGDSLSNIRSVQPAFTPEYLADLTPSDQETFGDDQLITQLDLNFSFDLFYLTAAYGLTDNIDISMALSINHAHMSGSAFAKTVDPAQNGGNFFVARFTLNQPGALANGGPAGCGAYRCAVDNFNQSATGTGDVYLRLKWHIADTWLADFAAAEVLTLPTGNADNLLGYHDPTFTPWLIASKNFGRISPHLNLGYAFRSGADVSQAQWIAGTDVLVTDWLTLGGDFLGYHDDKRDGINDDVVQSAVGFKVNPWGGLVLNGSFQFPVNRDGLRANVIYTAQIEYNF
jgi:hypothetical protein